MSKQDLVIYHNNCMDGFTAAWAAYRALNKPELRGMVYRTFF